MVNYYHRFLPNCADILQPLNSLLTDSKSSSKAVVWNQTADTAFTSIKEALANTTLLAHPAPDAPTCIMTDASDVAVGAVLQQCINDQWCPISYFSRTLKPAETRYSTFDRELLAIYLAIKHFQYFIEGREFYVLTDHKPLTYALSSHSNRHSPRQTRHLDLISQFTSDIRHVKGVDNPVADALSRVGANALELNSARPAIIDFKAMATAQATDPELTRIQSSTTTSLRFQTVPLAMSDTTIICDTSTGVFHPFVPVDFRQAVFHSLHSLLHPGIRAMQRLLTARYVWPSINADVRRWTRSCLQCQRCNVTQSHRSPNLLPLTSDLTRCILTL